MISVIIIAKNEEKSIKNCLESVRWADEIILADSYSTDGTAEIARGYGAKVFQKKFEGYGAQKNFALEKASGGWILSLDADEVVTPELRDEIIAAAKKQSGPAAYKIPRILFFERKLMKWGGSYPDYQVRLFKKGSARFGAEPVHEKLCVEGKTGKLKKPMIHYSYENLSDYFERFNRYTSLDAQKRRAKGVRFGLRHRLLPVYRFLSMYLLKLGFLDGSRGLDWAVLCSFYDAVKFMKLKEMENEK